MAEITVKPHNQDTENTGEHQEVLEIQFTRGIIGFPGSKNFELITDPRYAPFHKLVSKDEENVAFALMNPWLGKEDYEFTLSDTDIATLQITGPEDFQVFAIATLYPGKNCIGLNLLAPLVINRKNLTGAQIVTEDRQLPLQYLMEFPE